MKIINELKKALAEIGPITPWQEDDGWYFHHDAYPAVDYMADTPEDCAGGYRRVLGEFIQDRMAGNVAESVERITKGHGGARPGAGRRKGSRKEPTARLRLPQDVALWLQEDPDHVAQVRKLMG